MLPLYNLYPLSFFTLSFLNTISSLSESQSNKLTWGPPELVQHFRLWAEFISAPERCITYIWYGLALYRSPIPVRRRRVFYSFKWFYLPSLWIGGGGGSAPCGLISLPPPPTTLIPDFVSFLWVHHSVLFTEWLGGVNGRWNGTRMNCVEKGNAELGEAEPKKVNWFYNVKDQACSTSFDLPPPPPPLSKLDGRHTGRLGEGRGVGEGAKSYDGEKDWSSLNH